MPVITNVILRCDFCAKDVAAGSSLVDNMYTVPRHKANHTLNQPVADFMPKGWLVLAFGRKTDYIENLACDDCVAKIHAALPPPTPAPKVAIDSSIGGDCAE